MKRIALIIALLFVPFVLQAQTTNQLSQFEITWQFESPVEYGQFVNGDYWVVGPVTITNMLPEWSGTTNGWEINPLVRESQGFRAGLHGYTESLRPALPLVLNGGASLVKTKAGLLNSSYIRSAAVLTVLSNAPDSGGVDSFRPPYSGANKPIYKVSDLRLGLLPSIPIVGVPQELSFITNEFSKGLRMDHHSIAPRYFRPYTAMVDYMPKNTEVINTTMLRLLGNDPIEDKMPALIHFTQHAIDRAYIMQQGYGHAHGTGENPNQQIIAAWGAVMLGLTNLLTEFQTASKGVYEDLFLSKGTNNVVIWGEEGAGGTTESAYWTYIRTGSGNKKIRDPYRIIDGGNPQGSGYQHIVSQSFKGQALLLTLFPELQAGFRPATVTNILEYASRWVNHGYWTLPDPVAPYDGASGNYLITYGPDGAGGYIPGAGRWPARHGYGPDSGQYRSVWIAAMWDEYADIEGPPPIPSTPNTLSVIEANRVNVNSIVKSPL